LGKQKQDAETEVRFKNQPRILWLAGPGHCVMADIKILFIRSAAKKRVYLP
jgi:hypothetical protein